MQAQRKRFIYIIAVKVKIIAAILYKEEAALEEALSRLSARFGRTDYASPPFSFDVTGYYEPEMGPGLSRVIVSFADLADPAELPAIKRFSIAIEEESKKGAGRRVNIDTGYLDYDKMVLASTKPGPYKILMADNIWADMTLHYEKGAFHPFAWTFADFRDGRYDRAFLRVREIYKKQKPPG